MRAQDGAGGFSMDASFPGVIDSTRAVAMGDVDGDGDLDLLIGHIWGSDMLLINDGAGGFSVDTSFQQLVDTSLATTPSVWGVAMGDVDGDGDLDVLIGRELKANQLLINDGAGGFSVDASFPGGVANTHAVAMGDVDGDGDLDLLIGNFACANELLINDGLGGFSVDGSFPGGTAVTNAVAMGDVDGDGNLDLLIGNEYSVDELLLGDGLGGFSVDGSFPGESVVTKAVAMGDVDGDGDLDLLIGREQKANQLLAYMHCPDGGARLHAASACFACLPFMGRGGVDVCTECIPDYLAEGTFGTGESCSIPCVLGERRIGTDECTACKNISGTTYNAAIIRNLEDPSTWAAPRCEACPAGTISHETGAVCNACPDNSASPQGSSSIDACRCKSGYYNQQTADDAVECAVCPVGGNCSAEGATLGTLPLLKGFWRTGPTSANLLACPDSSSDDSACIGGSSVELCKPWCAAAGRPKAGEAAHPPPPPPPPPPLRVDGRTTGAYCTLCNVTDGSRYYDSGSSSCLKCSGGTTASTAGLVLGMVAAVLVALAAPALLRRLCSKFSRRLYSWALSMYLGFNLRSKLKQLFSLYQIVTKLETVYRVPMPAAVQSLLDILSFTSIDLASLGLPMGCLQLGNFEQQLAFNIFAPIVLIGAIAAGCALAALRPARRNGRATVVVVKEGLMNALPSCVLVTFLAFPMVASLAFEAFSCEDFDDGTSYLIADYSIPCDDDAQYDPIRRLAVAAIILYPIIVPTSYALLLHAARGAILSGRPSPLSKALDFLHRDVEPRCYWWEIAEIGKKLFMVGFVVLIQRGQTIQLVVGFSFCLVYLLFTNIFAPYTHDDDDFFATLCNFVLTATVFLCVVLKQATLAEAMDPYMSDDMHTTYWFDSALVSGLLFAIITAAALVAIGYSVQQFVIASRKPTIRLLSARKEPELSLGQGQQWHLFLSHIWSTGQDANATIKRQLCMLLLGVLIFLDVDDLEVTSATCHIFPSHSTASHRTHVLSGHRRSRRVHRRLPAGPTVLLEGLLHEQELPARSACYSGAGQAGDVDGRPGEGRRAARGDQE